MFRKIFWLPKKALIIVAGCIWLFAGINVARLGILAYLAIGSLSIINCLLSLLVFALFGRMFFKISAKNALRINAFAEERKPIWDFFNLKAYCIMAIMMGGGIWLRSSGLAPTVFIAFFYTGLGCALALAGLYQLYAHVIK